MYGLTVAERHKYDLRLAYASIVYKLVHLSMSCGTVLNL